MKFPLGFAGWSLLTVGLAMKYGFITVGLSIIAVKFVLNPLAYIVVKRQVRLMKAQMQKAYTR